MFKPSSAFVFPHLVFIKDVSFKSWSDSSKTTKLYKLDWTSYDAAIKKDYENHFVKCWPCETYAFVQTFNSYYESILQSLRFAVPQHYMDEIRRNTQMALSEWISRPFDTAIREMCLAPAIKYVEVAFKLLVDCAYDEDTQYFLRVDNKYVLPHMLLFRFWSHQTGSGMIMDHSDFGRLESRLASLKKHNIDFPGKDQEIASLEKFITFFANQAEEIQHAIVETQTGAKAPSKPGSVTTGPCIGPSIEGKGVLISPENTKTILQNKPSVYI